jgi:hypothetical protein
MQAGGAAQGVGTIHPRRRLKALLTTAAILVVAAVVALMVWVMPLAMSGVGTEEAVPKAAAGSAVTPDEELYYPLPHGKATPAVIDADGTYYPLPPGKGAPEE